MDEILSRIKNRVKSIDLCYLNMFTDYQGKESIRPVDIPTHATFDKIFLDDGFAWTKIDIGEPSISVVYQKCILLFSAVDRGALWGSAAATVLMRNHKVIPEEERMIELYMLAAVQSSHHRFFHVADEIHKSIEKNESPGVMYCKIARKIFGKIDGGPNPRFMPSSFNNCDVFSEDRNDNDINKLNKVKIRLIKLLKVEINQISKDANVDDIRAVIRCACAEITKIGANVQLGEFRLLILVQMCALTGFLVEPSPLLHNICYPVKGKASERHLKDVKLDPEDYGFAMEAICHEMSWSNKLNWSETCLCESIDGRRDYVYDILIYGINLHYLDEQGRAIIKYWSTRVWKLLGRR